MYEQIKKGVVYDGVMARGLNEVAAIYKQYNPNVIVKSGDANGDGKVDLNDFGIWKKEYLGQITTKTADFDGNGKVDLGDFGVWKRAYLEL